MSEDLIRLRDDKLEWREVEGRVLALDFDESRYLLVNETGRFLWGALARGTTRDELADRLCAEHDLPRERAEADVGAFLSELEERELIVPAAGPPAEAG